MPCAFNEGTCPPPKPKANHYNTSLTVDELFEAIAPPTVGLFPLSLLRMQNAQESPTPAKLQCPLLPFQRKALHWMLDRENRLCIRLSSCFVIAPATLNAASQFCHPSWTTAFRLPKQPASLNLPPGLQGEFIYCHADSGCVSLYKFLSPGAKFESLLPDFKDASLEALFPMRWGLARLSQPLH